MKKFLLTFSLLTASAFFMVPAARAEIDPDLKQRILSTADESFLIELLKQPGDADDDVFMKNLVVKRLMTVGTEACVPVLLDLIRDQRQSYNARFALEALESGQINPALEKFVTEMTGPTAVDLVASLGARRDDAAVPILKSLLESTDSSPEMKRGVVTALGFIASPEAVALLTAEAEKGESLDAKTLRTLGNSLVFAGTFLERKGNSDAAISLYRAAAGDAFPDPIRFTAKFHALAASGRDSIPAIAEKLTSDDSTKRKIALAAIPILPPDAGEPLVEGVKGIFDRLDRTGEDVSPNALRCAVLTALAARTDDATGKAFLPWLKETGDAADLGLSAAILRIYQRIDYNAAPEAISDALAFADGLFDRAETAALLPSLATAYFRIDRPEVDRWALDRLSAYLQDGTAFAADELSVLRVANLLDLIKWRRTSGADPLLTELVTKGNPSPTVRDAAYVALAETVPLERLTAFIELTSGLGGDVPQVLLNRACSRLPRDASAQEAISLFDRSDAESRRNLIGVLRQIGGDAAVDRVAAAALDPETVDAATKTLGEWDKQADMERVADACLKLATELKNEKYRIRVVKGFIRVPRQFDLPAEKRIAMADAAFALEGRNEDRGLVFDIFERIIDVRSVAAAMNYADHDLFREKACETAVKVAEKIHLDADAGWGWYTVDPDEVKAEEAQRTANRKTVTDLMERVAALTKNADLAARARTVADRNR